MMKRDPEALAQVHHDILVVGGGIYGACIARDAALRGLSVALLEKEDFGHATSANSLKFIHGGLRYLQDGNLRLARAMAQERKAWLRIAPHLVRPLPCLMPTTRQLSRSRLMLALGAAVNDCLAYDRNRGLSAGQEIPRGGLLSRDEFLRRAPGVAADGITGALLWYDGQVANTERLLLAIVGAAAAAGAHVANYVEVTGLLRNQAGVSGVTALDPISGRELAVRARLVILCAGVWTDSLLSRCGAPQAQSTLRQSLAVNLVTRQLGSDYAMALPTRPGRAGMGSVRPPRTLFIVPWQQYSLIGTLHLPCRPGRELCPEVDEDTIAAFLTAINAAYPEAQLAFADVRHVHVGFLPARGGGRRGEEVRLLRESQIVDHASNDGLAGLLSVSGVKYTTARHTAQKVVDLALKKLGRRAQPCSTHVAPVAGGDTGDFAAFASAAKENAPRRYDAATIQHLVANYGAAYSHVLGYAEQEPLWRRPVSAQSPVLAAEVVHAVRDEMAIRLADVVQRRTILGAAGPPDAAAIEACAVLMGDLLGWSPRQRQEEIDRLCGSYQRHAWPGRVTADR